MKDIKVSRNVTFSSRNLQKVVELMSKSGKNFSFCINLMIQQWADMVTEIKRVQAEKQVEQIKQAKTLNEIKQVK